MSQVDDQNSKKQKGPRWMRILLVVSLGLNLAVVGVLAGTAYRMMDRQGGKTPPPPSLSVMLYRALDPDVRHRLMREATGDHPNVRAQREADRQALFQSLEADPFDAQAVADVLADQAQRQYQFRETLRQSWLDQLAQMSDAERAELLERLKKDPRHHKKRDGQR